MEPLDLSLDQSYMRQAIRQAQTAANQDEVPVGTVIVCKNQIVAKAHNQVEMLKDPTAHAEMIAITQASNSISNKWLYDCTMYVTIEPCSMCAGAIVLARMKRLVFGAYDTKTGACGSISNIVENNQLNHQVKVKGGFLKEETGNMMSQYFEQKRKVQK